VKINILLGVLLLMSLLVLSQAKKRDHLQMAARLRKAGKKECTP
jgi:hypothetical protein